MTFSTNPFKFLILAALMLAPMMLTACNTMEGAGKDIQAGGENLEDAAHDNKSY